MNNIKIILLLTFFAVLSSCTREGDLKWFRKIEIEIDPRLPKDQNGMYYYNLYSNPGQSIHRISGSIRLNGRIPDNPRLKVEWKNNLYWYILPGDTLFRVSKSYLNQYTGQWTQVVFPPMLAWKPEAVPTINKSSYNDVNGEINTVIAPIWAMRGDTMLVSVECEDIQKSIKIILK